MSKYIQQGVLTLAAYAIPSNVLAYIAMGLILLLVLLQIVEGLLRIWKKVQGLKRPHKRNRRKARRRLRRRNPERRKRARKPTEHVTEPTGDPPAAS